LLVDIHPNYEKKPTILTHKANDIIKNLLKAKGDLGKITVVIDTSTHHFYDDEIKKILAVQAKEIRNGRLNLVLIHSMAKYIGYGLDKFSAGTVVGYNNKDLNLGLSAEDSKFVEKIITILQ
jgi:ribosomal protein L31